MAAPAQAPPVDHGAALAVEASGLTRTFEDVTAVRGVDLTVPAGTILGIIGPSGSGKTTTIRMLLGTLKPSAGTVRVLGEAPTLFRRQTRERIGYMPQRSILYPDLTVAEHVDFVASVFGLLLFRRRRRKRHVLELLDLWQVRDRRASRLSGGMQRRLALACALVHEPALLVLDEPTAGIDPLLRRTVWEELRRLRERGVTILATTQYVTEAEHCDQVALIARGKVVAVGAPADLRERVIGGEALEITTTEPFDAGRLSALATVRRIRQSEERRFTVIVDNAGAATPDVVDAVNEAGAQVDSVRESRPTFEDVFARLVEDPLPVEEPDRPAEREGPDGAA